MAFMSFTLDLVARSFCSFCRELPIGFVWFAAALGTQCHHGSFQRAVGLASGCLYVTYEACGGCHTWVTSCTGREPELAC